MAEETPMRGRTREGQESGIEIEQQLPALDRTTLDRLVRQVLGRDEAELAGWNHRPIYSGLGAA